RVRGGVGEEDERGGQTALGGGEVVLGDPRRAQAEAFGGGDLLESETVALVSRGVLEQSGEDSEPRAGRACSGGLSHGSQLSAAAVRAGAGSALPVRVTGLGIASRRARVRSVLGCAKISSVSPLWTRCAREVTDTGRAVMHIEARS